MSMEWRSLVILASNTIHDFFLDIDGILQPTKHQINRNRNKAKVTKLDGADLGRCSENRRPAVTARTKGAGVCYFGREETTGKVFLGIFSAPTAAVFCANALLFPAKVSPFLHWRRE